MKCSNCKHEISDDSLFCDECGTKIEVSEKNPEYADDEAATKEEASQVAEELNEQKEAYTEIVQDSNIINIQQNTDEAVETSKNLPIKNKNLVIIILSVLGGIALLLITALIFIHLHKSVNTFKNNNTDIQKVDSGEENVQISEISFAKKEISLNSREKKKLEVQIYPQNAKNKELIWSSSKPKEIMIDQKGLVTGLKEGSQAIITVKDAVTQKVSAECKINVLSKEQTFLQTVEWLNTNDVALNKINVYQENYSPNKRNPKLEWNSNLFYALENIDEKSDEDGKIRFYNIEKKQLINEETGNLMEYEIYSNPDTNEVNKIVSIEYIEDRLEIVDYYYEAGKVNFIFKRQDSVYTPTYASPDKVGERYYYNDDVMVKWRVINIPLKVKDYTLKEGKDQTAYDKLPQDLKQAFDANEVKMLNAAYNTYNTVLQARSIGYIKGYVTDIDGRPVIGASVKVFSNQYELLVSEYLTDPNGYYNIPVPSNAGSYFIRISNAGYISTDIYDVDMTSQFLGSYQENVYLIPNNNASYNIHFLLCDAFNKMTYDTYDQNSYADDSNNEYINNYYGDNNMLRLSNAMLNIRPGINNKSGQVYTTVYADEYGMVYTQLPAGTYTGEIIKSGYSTSYFTIVAKTNEEYIQSNTTPVLGENEVRIVLTWGNAPSDLDSHLFTPYQGAAGDMQHIGYSAKSDSYGNNLDVDDTSSYGPETITINNLDTGSYKYYVSDYTDCSHGDYASYAMSLSGAKVSVYTKDGLIQIFNVPQSKEGVIWEVFEIRNKQVIPIQRYYNNISDKPWWNFSK